MTTDEESHITRTSRGRFGKGLAVIVIIMAIGAGIHVAYSDFWNKYPPSNQVTQAEGPREGPVLTGQTKEFTLTFVESADLRTLGFNKLPGEEGANPDLVVNLGDKVIIHAINGGIMPHAFGVVSNPEDPTTVLFNARIKSADNPILKGQEGTVEFIPDKAGEFYYICLVPGHPLQGMQGKFIVNAAGAPAGGGAPVKPTGASQKFDLSFTETSDLRTLGFNAPKGEANANPEIRVKAGDSVTINVVHNGVMPHAFGVVTDPDEPASIVFNSAIKSANNPILKGQSGSVTFIADKPGNYFYICTVPGHSLQGMQGNFIVE